MAASAPVSASPVSIPAQSSLLPTSALTTWLRDAYGLDTPTCRLISSSLSDTYEVVSHARRSYLRAYRHGWRTRMEIEAEASIVLDLADRGLPVAPPVPTREGAHVTTIDAPEGERFLVLWQEAPGQDVRDITTAQACAYGELAARLHDAWDAAPRYDRFDLDHRHLLDESLMAICQRFGDSPGCLDDLRYLERVAGGVRARLVDLPRRGSGWGLCHGDLHPGNVRFTGDRPTLFDFDCMGYGWRAYDLTVFHWNITMERRAKRWREQRWRAFLRGYARVRPLPEDLEETLPIFLIARMIWLLGLDCAGKSGYPPQWVNPDSFRQTIGFIRGWETELGLVPQLET